MRTGTVHAPALAKFLERHSNGPAHSVGRTSRYNPFELFLIGVATVLACDRTRRIRMRRSTCSGARAAAERGDVTADDGQWLRPAKDFASPDSAG